MLKEVGNGFERVVGSRFGVSKKMEKELDSGLVCWVEEEMLSEAGKSDVGNGGNGVGLDVVSG